MSRVVGRHLYRALPALPLALAVITLILLAVGYHPWAAAVILFVRGLLNSAIPVAWSTWLTQGLAHDPEAGGGLMVAVIQLAIMLGAAFGGLLLDHVSLAATWFGGAALLVLASFAAGSGRRLRPALNTR
ncbi:MAG: hypothetical protein ABI178_07825 [Rhodanobacter sp.]